MAREAPRLIFCSSATRRRRRRHRGWAVARGTALAFAAITVVPEVLRHV